MKLTMEEAEEFVVLPAGSLITVRIDEIEQRTATTRNGKEFEKLNFKFTVVNIIALGDGGSGDPDDYAECVGNPIYGSVSARFTTSTENKLRQWVSAILGGVELEAGFELDTDLLIGQRVRALTAQYTKKGYSSPSQMVEALVPALEVPGAPAAAPWADSPQAAPAGAGGSAWPAEPPF